MPNDPVELNHRFAYHPPPTTTVAHKHEETREGFWQVANWVNDNIPDGREKQLVFTKLEEAMFWANAAIARNHPPALLDPPTFE